jgi:phosphoribosyl-AMP cyclohydrolase
VYVQRIVVDCDDDTVLLEVVPESPACHYGYQSCFFKEVLPKQR